MFLPLLVELDLAISAILLETFVPMGSSSVLAALDEDRSDHEPMPIPETEFLSHELKLELHSNFLPLKSILTSSIFLSAGLMAVASWIHSFLFP